MPRRRPEITQKDVDRLTQEVLQCAKVWAYNQKFLDMRDTDAVALVEAAVTLKVYEDKMASTRVHVLVPHTTEAACGVPHPTKTSQFKEMITCPLCKDTIWYKELKNYKTRVYRVKRDTC